MSGLLASEEVIHYQPENYAHFGLEKVVQLKPDLMAQYDWNLQ
jgi:hypothetical protein